MMDDDDDIVWVNNCSSNETQRSRYHCFSSGGDEPVHSGVNPGSIPGMNTNIFYCAIIFALQRLLWNRKCVVCSSVNLLHNNFCIVQILLRNTFDDNTQ